MFDANLAIHDEAAADSTATQIYASGAEVKRLVNGSLAEPEMMVINHTTSGSGENIVDRHLVQFTKSQVGDVTGREYKTTVNLTLAVPRIASADSNTSGVPKLVGWLQNFLNATDVAQAQTNVSRVVTGES